MEKRPEWEREVKKRLGTTPGCAVGFQSCQCGMVRVNLAGAVEVGRELWGRAGQSSSAGRGLPESLTDLGCLSLF